MPCNFFAIWGEFGSFGAILGNVYLPVAFSLSDKKKFFVWDNKSLLEKSNVYLDINPLETGSSLAKFATRSLVSQENFMHSALSTGHINISSDPDGTYRHYPLIIRIDSGYFPSIALASFLNSVRVSFQDIIINWGQSVIIPACENNEISTDLRIPIDSSGHVIIPFFKFSTSQENTFERYDASDFLREYSRNSSSCCSLIWGSTLDPLSNPVCWFRDSSVKYPKTVSPL